MSILRIKRGTSYTTSSLMYGELYLDTSKDKLVYLNSSSNGFNTIINTNYNGITSITGSLIISGSSNINGNSILVKAIPLTYTQLSSSVSAKTLTDQQTYEITDFCESWTSGSVVISGSVEPLVVTALTSGSLNLIAASKLNPKHYIEYTIENTLITGATKGVILKRIDNNRNEFGYGFNNSFGIDCNSNTFGNYCHSNTFVSSCHLNTFGNNCFLNTFGIDCNLNTFGNYCHSNTFGNSCHLNTFGNNCFLNTFGNYCRSNTFGNSCYLNTFGNDCKNNILSDNIRNIDFTSSTYSTWQTHLQADYKCKVFKLPNGSLCLEYVNSDGQTVTLVAE